MPTALIRLQPAGAFKEGQEIKWDHLTWYKVLKVNVVGGYAFISMEGHPLSVCTIWHTVDLPWR